MLARRGRQRDLKPWWNRQRGIAIENRVNAKLRPLGVDLADKDRLITQYLLCDRKQSIQRVISLWENPRRKPGDEFERVRANPTTITDRHIDTLLGKKQVGRETLL
jgi:hypothetical protein